MTTMRPSAGSTANCTFDPPVATDAGERLIAHDLVLDVGQRLGRRHGDRVAGVHPHGVDVLDGADDHAVVGVIAHDLELVLLPAGDGLLDEDLADGAGGDAVGGEATELIGRGRDTGATTTEDVRRPDDGGQADVVDDGERLVEVVGDTRPGGFEPDLGHGLLEQVAVFGRGDGLGLGADELDAELGQDSRGLELHGQVQTGLSAQGGQNGIGALLAQDLAEDLDVEGLDVGGVGEVGIGHDGGRVRVGQDRAIALFAQHPAGLRARVVELAGLADHDGTGSDDEDRLEVVTAGHQRAFFPKSSMSWSNMANR
jgi:hypothetical protein